MSDQFIGEIRLLPFGFAPKFWMRCEGQILGIAQNTALFSILGTTYGGNGQSTFGLPDLRGRSPVHWGQGPGLQNYVLGEVDGASTVSLISTEMPMHTHAVSAVAGVGTSEVPALGNLAQSSIRSDLYKSSPSSMTVMSPLAVGSAGGSQAHNNMPPYLAVAFCIAVQGIFPARN